LHRSAFTFLAVAIALPGADWEWNLPNGFPRPAVPADNPMSVPKVELGRYLFYDKRMSVNPCCHAARAEVITVTLPAKTVKFSLRQL